MDNSPTKTLAAKIAVIIPAFNEEQSIVSVVNAVSNISNTAGIKLVPVVVNDCSTDNTALVLKETSAVLLDLPVNLGIGGAVQTGILYALENNFDFAVQVDGDGQHPAQFIPDLVNAALNQKVDVVVGSRFMTKDGFLSTKTRRAGIKWFYLLNRFLTGTRVLDATSGFRLFNRNAIRLMADNYPDDYPEPEAIVLFSRAGLKIAEIPVKMKEREGGVSSIRGFSTLYYMWKVSLGIIFTYFRKIK